MKPPAVIRAEAALGVSAESWAHAAGGYTHNERWVVRFADGRSAFVKGAVDEMTTEWLRTEHLVYSTLAGAPFLPRLLAWQDGELPVLVLEDLTDAEWPPPWSERSVDAAYTALEHVAATPPPTRLPRLEDAFDGGSWTRVAEDPAPFLSLQLCTPAWVERALPALLEATAATPFAGTELVHVDVRSDNLCISDGRALLVDWNQACVGNAAFDPAVLRPSMRAEGGAARDVPGTDAFAAWIAGFFAARAALPPPPTAPTVRPLQLAQLREALPWTIQVLDLPPLDHS